MYLEPTRSLSAIAVGSKVMCNNGTYDPTPAGAQTFTALCTGRGGVKFITPPTMPPKPKFKTGYSLKGTPPSKDWFYPACNAGYTKQQVNKPHPQMYSCFDPAELAWNKKYGIMM